jgi:hypothetical protein
VFLTCSCEQINELAVPYAVSVHGMSFQDNASNGASITELYIAAAKYNEKTKGLSEELIMQRITENPQRFTSVRAKFSSLLISYHTSSRSYVADILHSIFSTPRGASSTVVPADKLSAIHEMLKLQHGQALLDTTHPVCKEYDPEPGGGIKRLFPGMGAACLQVFTKHSDPQSETSKFHAALGKLQILQA